MYKTHIAAKKLKYQLNVQDNHKYQTIIYKFSKPTITVFFILVNYFLY